MDLSTATTLVATLSPLLVGLTRVSLGRGRFALEGRTPEGAWVFIDRPAEARAFLAA